MVHLIQLVTAAAPCLSSPRNEQATKLSKLFGISSSCNRHRAHQKESALLMLDQRRHLHCMAGTGHTSSKKNILLNRFPDLA